MSGNRFKMDFNNNNNVPLLYKQYLNTLAVPQKLNSNKNQSLSLNSAMINRVHTAKPGCSACGKKVY